MNLVFIIDRDLGEPANFGIAKLMNELRCLGYKIEKVVYSSLEEVEGYKIIFSKVNSNLLKEISNLELLELPEKDESFSLIKLREDFLLIIGYDDIGLMYGCFEMLDQIKIMKRDINSLISCKKSPDIRIRELYTFLHNTDIEKDWLYSKEYWEEFLSMLAYYRYNEFNLIFGHQTSHLIPIYPYLFNIEEYPQVYVEGLTKEEQNRNLSTLQYISSLCKKKGIKFYLGIWQSKPWQIKDGKIEGLHIQESRVKGLSDENLIDYTRLGVKKLLKLCPDIEGLQLRMNIESGISNQNFFIDAFIPGIKESGKDIEIELRNWGLKIDTLNTFKKYFPKLRISFKYFAEHQAMPYQPPQMRNSYSYDDLLRNDRDYPILWHLWNLGTHRLFLWGDPQYVKNFVQSVHLGDGLGFHITPPLSQKGFSQYGERPGNWSIYKENIKPWYKWEYERYWFFYALWGRLGYEPNLEDEYWIGLFENRFGKQKGKLLFEAYVWSSKVISYLISHHMEDPNMYIWLEIDNGGLIDHFGKIPPGEKTLFMNSKEYVESIFQGINSAKIDPFQASKDLLEISNHIDAILEELEKVDLPDSRENEEYELSKVDFKVLSLLSQYNAKKILASVYLELFYKTECYSFLKEAEANAEKCLEIWKELIDLTDKYFYDELQLGPTGGCWKYNLPYVEYDLRRIKAVKDIFEKYGLFLYGFDFGAPQGKEELVHLWYERPTNSTLEPRFTPVDPYTMYSKEKGYGWLSKSDDLFSKRAPVINSWGLRGTHHHELNLPIEELPAEMLSPDYVGGKGKAIFRVDLPKAGRYMITILLGASLDEAESYGTMSILINDKKIKTDIPKGSTKEIKEIIEAFDHIDITFEALEKNWIVNGLIIQDCDTPFIRHFPLNKVARHGEDLIIKVTAFCPLEEPSLILFYKRINDPYYNSLKMGREDNLTYSAKIYPLTEDVEYYIEVSTSKNKIRYPDKSNFKIRILPEDYKSPSVKRHNQIYSFKYGEKIKLFLEVEDDKYISDIKLYVREVNQNVDFRCIRMEHVGENKFYVNLDTSQFAKNYDLMYYFEVLDSYGNSIFYPDPINNFNYGRRYFVVKESK